MTSPQPAFPPPLQQQPPPPPRPPGDLPWTRSSTDKVIAGVCGGLGRRLGIDPVILRVVAVVLVFFAGAGIVLYAAAWLFMPSDRTNHSVLSEALGSPSSDRTRSVLTTLALVAVLTLAAVAVADSGFVPGVLIALVIVAILLVVRRDEAAAAQSQHGQSPYGQSPYGQTPYGRPPEAWVPGGSSSVPPSSPPAPPYATQAPWTTTGSEPTIATSTGAEPTVALGEPGVDPTVTLPQSRPSDGPIPPIPPWTAPSWGPPVSPPPPPPYIAVPPMPPAPPKERSYLGVLTLSAMIATLGGLSIVDLSGVAVPVTAYVVAALAVVAAGLILGAWIGRSRGLIALGIVLAVGIVPAAVVDVVAGSDWGDWRNAHDLRVHPQVPSDLDPVYDYGAGSIRIDLTDLDFEGEELGTRIDLGAGEVVIMVPADVDVTVDASVEVGDLQVFDQQSSGFDADQSFTDFGNDGDGGGRLDLSIELGLGSVEVRRATS